MNSATAGYQESSSFIHQRYEDTAHTIFSQQQKVRQDEKRREKQRAHANPQNQLAVTFPYKEAEVNRYGNRAVLLTEPDVKPKINGEKSTSPPHPINYPTPKPKETTVKEAVSRKESSNEPAKPADFTRPREPPNSVDPRVLKPPGQATIKSSVCIIS